MIGERLAMVMGFEVSERTVIFMVICLAQPFSIS